ncbi:uncharacterized protein TNCV_675771 [Trichonephila clavipes]|nr:uncharacterized protein TNCV_675771 [Trichonephila clavipes]
MLRHCMKDSCRGIGQVDRNQENSEYLGKPRGSQSIAGPSHQQDSRQDKSSTVASRHEGSGQNNKARETKTTKNGTNREAERRTVRSRLVELINSTTRRSYTGWEDPRLKRKVRSNGSVDRKDLKRSKICRKRSLQGSEHRDQKRPTPGPKQGIKRAIPSSVSTRNHRYRRPNIPSQGSQSIVGPSHQRDTRQAKPPTEGSRKERSGQYDKTRETRTTKSGTNRAAEMRPVRSKQATVVRPCPYYKWEARIF